MTSTVKQHSISSEKRERIDNIVSELLTDNTETAKIDYGSRIGSILRDAALAIKYDWDDETILLEITSSFYESMLNISDKYTPEEIDINNDSFMREVYNKTRCKIKGNLIDPTRKRNNKKYMNIQTVALDAQYKEQHEDFIYDNQEYESDNYFLSWFNDSRESILTKKQNLFIDTDIVSESNASYMRKKIYSRTMKACEKQFNTTDANTFNTKYQLSILEEILDSKNTLHTLNKYKDKPFISELLLSISSNNRKLINKNITTKESLRELRTILYKEYNRLSKEVNN